MVGHVIRTTLAAQWVVNDFTLEYEIKKKVKFLRIPEDISDAEAAHDTAHVKFLQQ